MNVWDSRKFIAVVKKVRLNEARWDPFAAIAKLYDK